MAKESEEKRDEAEEDAEERADNERDDLDDDLDDDDDDDADDDGDDDEDEDLDDDDDDEDEDLDDDDDDDDGDEDDDGGDQAAAPAPTPKKRAAPKRRRGRVVRKKGNPTRNIMLFVALVGGIAVMMAVFGKKSARSSRSAPAWKAGQTVDVEITLVTGDLRNLACAMEKDVKGLHCAWEKQNRRSQKPSDPTKDDTVLQPYTTVDGKNFLASALWVQPALKKKIADAKKSPDLEPPRFTVDCKLKVEGKAKGASVRWKRGAGWGNGAGWATGKILSCKDS